MSHGIYSALSGAIAQQRALDVVANNVANVGTTGYRADRAVFEEALTAAEPDALGRSQLRFTAVGEISTVDSPGVLRQTDNSLDVALQGDGYFAVRTAAGERFTRAGAFVTDGDGTLRTLGGAAVLDTRGRPLSLPSEASQILIAPDGTISADGADLGGLRVVRFATPDALSKEGGTLFAAREGTRALPVDDRTQVVQGHVELSNVNAVAGLNELITVSRSFEAFQKVIETFQRLDERAARDVGARG